MFADQLRAAIRTATPAVLDTIMRAAARAAAEGAIGEVEFETIAEAVQTRRSARRPSRQTSAPSRRRQARPDPERSIARRRQLAASGPLPPAIASRFTVAELAVLRIIGDEVRRHGVCTRSVAELAARAGCGRTSVQNAIRAAVIFGLLVVTERRLTAWRNEPNVIRIVSSEWSTWLRIGPKGGGFKKANRTDSEVIQHGFVGAHGRPEGALRRRERPPGGK